MTNFVSTATYKVFIPNAAATPYVISGAVQAFPLGFAQGTPPLTRRIQSTPLRDGGIDQGFRLEPRRFVWELFVQDTTESLFEARLDALHRIFKPYDLPITIEVDRAGFGNIYQLDCYVDGPVSFQQSAQLGLSGILRVPLYAPDPLWRLPHTTTTTSTLGSSSVNVTVPGNYPDWPLLEIRGMVQDFVLSTSMTNAYRTITAVINLTGTTIADGDTYTIDLRNGRKTVTDTAGVGRADKLIDESWPNFQLWPAPFKVGGVNTLTYSFTSKNANGRLRIIHYGRYLSI